MKQNYWRWWYSWTDPCFSLLGYSCPMRRTARINCFVLLSYRWPPLSLSELDPVIIVSAINFLLKVHLGKALIKIDPTSWPTKGFACIISLGPQPYHEGSKRFVSFSREQTQCLEGLCVVTVLIWWTRTQVS